jgi:proteasome lid subunit RPN8/RPN11
MRLESGEERRMMKLASAARDEIIAHARKDAPIEACGYLAEKDGVVSRVFRLTNADASPEHYTLVPAEQFAAVREMRKSGYELRAVYHSHPASQARMSREDLRLAFDCGLSYVIVSLAGEEPIVNSFTISDGAAIAEEIEMFPATEERR